MDVSCHSPFLPPPATQRVPGYSCTAHVLLLPYSLLSCTDCLVAGPRWEPHAARPHPQCNPPLMQSPTLSILLSLLLSLSPPPFPISRIKYMRIYEDSSLTFGLFCFPAGATIPLHNHPGMTVFSRLGSVGRG